MDQIIIVKRDGSEMPIQSRHFSTDIKSAKQSIDLLSKDVVNISVESPFKQNYDIGDSIIVFGRVYKLNRLPIAKKNGANNFVYDLEFEGVQYDLLRATYDLTIETTNNQLQDFQANSLTGSLSIFAVVWLANANRVLPGQWALGVIPETDEDRTLMFSEEANCLSVLSDFCKEFDTEYKIEQVEGVNTLHFTKIGSTHANTFEYGKGKGIYQLTRQNVSSSNLITRLKAFGSNRNITSKYRAHRLCLPTKTRSQSFIEDVDLIDKYGIFEATKNFDDIYPKRTGKVTALGGDIFSFKDDLMFDLNEKEADGITTKYLLPGVSAKIHFNSGNLAGYEFEIESYNHDTKTIKIKGFSDDRGSEFPSAESIAFQFAINDEYKLLDIALPQSYVDTAEALLEEKAIEYYQQNSQPKVQYSLSIDPVVLEKQVGSGTIANTFMVGDYIKIKDADIGVDKAVRIKGFTRDILKPYEYSLTISDTVTESVINRVISESIEVDNIIKINNLKDPARAKRNWKTAQEVLNMTFDPEGNYFTDKIKPESIETIALSVGAKSMQFGLTNTIFQPNYNSIANLINVEGGVLSHYTINENEVRSWNLSSGETNFSTNDPYYIYAKCERDGTAGSIIFSPEQIKTEADANYYHFWVGVVNSVDPIANVRAVSLSYGFTMVNGRFIRTGRISSQDGKTYFDLDNNEIKGRITFLSSTGDSVEMGDYADSIAGDISDAQAAANAAALKAQQAIDDATTNIADINSKFAEQQAQLDGEVSNWFYPYTPTNSNYPSIEWITEEEKARHIGDTFTNTTEFVDNTTTPDAGKSWRYLKNGSYGWTLIADSDAVKALLQAAKAQGTADGKSTTYLFKPTKYKLGDTWILNANETVNGIAYKAGDQLQSTQSSEAFNQAHWTKKIRYTDDTKANEASGKADDADAKASQAKAITDKFGTTIDGGLISTVMMLLREANSQTETAGISGIQGVLRNNPAVWAGGKYEEAFRLISYLSAMSKGTTPGTGAGQYDYATEYPKLAKITLLHNGSAKIGDFIIEESGRIVMVDPNTGVNRLVFSVGSIPDAYDLIQANTGTGSISNASRYLDYQDGYDILPNKMTVTKVGSSITINAQLSLTIDRYGLNISGYATFSLELYRDGVFYKGIDTYAMIGSLYGDVGPNSDSVVVNQTIHDCPTGEYSLRIKIFDVTRGDAPNDMYGIIQASTMSWNFSQPGVRSLEFGRDGFYALWENMMFHVSQAHGLVVTGKTDMPGVLSGGSIAVSGLHGNKWGAKAGGNANVITGGFRIPLIGMKHDNYTVQITPHTTTTFRIGVKTSTYFEVFGTGAFDYLVIGSNN